MRALIQRVSHAEVVVGGERIAAIGTGILALIGVQTNDGEESFVRRDSLQIKGEGMIGLGRLPEQDSPQNIRFECEET